MALKSLRNLESVHVLVADQLNTYDVLCADDMVFTQAALDRSSPVPSRRKPPTRGRDRQ